MRDLGFLVWIVLLFIGVMGSVVSSIRKQSQQAGSHRMAGRQRANRWAPSAALSMAPSPAPNQEAPRAPPRSPAPPKRPAAPAPPVMPDHHMAVRHHVRLPRPLFGARNSLVGAVIAAEVLGKPRGLADEYPFR